MSERTNTTAKKTRDIIERLREKGLSFTGGHDYNRVYEEFYNLLSKIDKLESTPSPSNLAGAREIEDSDKLEYAIGILEAEMDSLKDEYHLAEKPEHKTERSVGVLSIMKALKLLRSYALSTPTSATLTGADGDWISPVQKEAETQDRLLKQIFGHYPNASPKWQYMNALIQMAIDLRSLSTSATEPITEWISVEDRLPEDETECNVVYDNGKVGNSWYWNNNEGFDPYADPIGEMVTHWQPLPKPPTSEKKV